MQLIKSCKKDNGFSAIGLMIFLAVLAAAATVAVPLLIDAPQVSREQLTRKKMQAIKEAIVGKPDIQPGRYRHSFGFVGDLGILPANLDDLFLQGSYPTYTNAPVNNIRFGWQGPYLDSRQTNSGFYLALIDAWGTPFDYTIDINNNATLSSAGPDQDFPSNGDNISLLILEDEWRTSITGHFYDPHKANLNETELHIYYPDGSANLAEMVLTPTDPHTYNTLTDPVSGSERKIPIGLRYFYAKDIAVTLLATLNGGPVMNVDLIGAEESHESDLFKNSFDNPTDLGPTDDSPLHDFTGSWTISGGDLTSSQGYVAFGYDSWRDYRLETDVTLSTGAKGFGIFYRSNGLEETSGYLFQFNPGLYSPFGDGIELLIRRVHLGDEAYFPPERQILANRIFTRSDFETLFGNQIWTDSIHISITVNAERHIVKINGVPLFDTTDTEPLFLCSGLCGKSGFVTWDGEAAFHHVLVHTIPPLPDGEIVRWPFEEGNGNRFFGSGFLVDGPEQNGIVSRAQRLATGGIYGAAMRLSQTNPVQYLSLPDHNDLDLSSAGTLSCWIYPEENNQERAGLIHKGNLENETDLAYSLEFDNNDQLKFILVNSSGSTFELVSVKKFGNSDTNRWSHILATWDNKGMAIYINGVLNKENIQTVSVRNSNAPLNLGASFTMSIHAQRHNQAFKGRIDEIQLFKQRLTADQINTLYHKYID